MTLTELRYLVNLDKERHFGRAAERSFVSQPTLSVAVKKLEDELGVLLFERNRGEARPTPVGERVITQARRVLAEAKLIDDLAREGRDELAGPLRFGAIYTVGPYLLPQLIPVIRQSAPQMPLMIEENFTAKLLEQLRDNELDVIAVALPVDLQGLSAWPLYDEDFVVLMPQDHRWKDETEIPARRLAEEQLLLLGPGHCFREQVVQACPKCVEPDGDGPRPQTGSSLETIRHMVAGGLGITVLPRSSVENRGDEAGLIVAKPFAPRAPTRRIALVWRKTYPRLAAIAALRDAILACPLRGVTMLPDETRQEH
ncbi:LysR family transcriptional regulator, hydrogen peroxide-inducible genes activator [Hydrocarboniphaga daqingensis]|jgi:LysR family hydrogen peroxide-inducible transcriptional activator|uniref:LysR family transcriptional regulator, hydrogen peroxide-inducible genes activator n=1 Tax=Hydrocarboniphaga daqingensis TaxID=490188 RepID=A0A1M5LJ23_9GAMM|nr:hydrogen peroxide-inducible genes activator [Hydrocarboniphaga daqingensis]SHG64363.1 LysR family transcriptional regulator, hydrogen peroxide-inducible genes activator [Hydrocarboniphaga daqingensis]